MVSSSPVPLSSPEMDRFLTAMLRAVGGTLVINPMDSVIGMDESIQVTELTNGCYKYELVENQSQSPSYHPDIDVPVPTPGASWVEADGTIWTGQLDPIGWYRYEKTADPKGTRLVWMDRKRWDSRYGR